MNKFFTCISIVLFSLSNLFAQTNWTPVSPNLFPTNASGQIHGLSRVAQVKFHPTNSSKVYAVSSRGGLFISSNSGTTWTLAAGCDVMPQMRLASVCVNFTNDQIIYLGTGDQNYYYNGSGVYKSIDGGATFSPTSLTSKMVVEILMDPADQNTLIAATNVGIYKSTNAGSTWTLKSGGTLACRDMVFKVNTVANTKTIYAATYSELYRSTDMGETWTQITSGIYFPVGSTTGGGCRVAVTPADSNLVYFSMVANNGTIFKSTDAGTTFVNVKDATSPNLTAYDDTPTSTGQGDYNCMFNADPVNGNILYFGSHNFWKSTNGGVNWTKMTNWYAELHTDMHWVKVNPYNTSQIWTANDGGVWVSTNGGTNWTPKSDGIYGYEIYHGVCSPTRKDMFSIGTQDNGELYHSAGIWYTNRGGDWSAKCAFDYRSNSTTVYYFDRDKRRAVTGSDATYGLPVTTLQDLAFYRGYPNLAFAGNQEIYRTTNLLSTPPTWTLISAINKTIKAVHVNLADSNRVYVIGSDATINVCNNALAATPVFTSYTLPNATSNSASLTNIKSAPNVLYAVLNTRVYRSADNGATWSDVSYNLPSINWVKIIPDEYFSSNELVFVAGNTSVYYRKAGQTSWTLFSSALPTRTVINDFSVYDDGTNQSALRVSEYGRGMWEVPLTGIRAVTALFTANGTNPCPGSSVQFSDQSTGNVTSWAWSFPGGTPSTSTIQNPLVTYSASGTYNVTLTVSDGVSTNSITKTSYINTFGSGLPLAEGFENTTFPPTGWTSIDDGNDSKVWQRTTAASGFGTSTASMWFDNYSMDVAGKKDEMRTPRFDIAGLTTAQLTFDVSYQPYNTTNYSDSLQVLVSTNCGASFNVVYFKGGSTLSTVAGTNTSAFTPTSVQWRTETINLSSYSGSGNILVSFKNLGYYGNNIYIDNIGITGTFSVNAGPDKTSCVGDSVSIGLSSVSGFDYLWSPIAGLSSSINSNPKAAPSTTTSYILTATKTGSGITAKDTVIVNVDNVPISSTVTDVSCYGGNNGAITLSFVSGIAPYSYLWNNGSTSQSRSGLIAGAYSVTITDGAMCTRTYSFTVTQPLSPLSAATSTTQSSCNLSNGSATVIPAGGTLPYTYSWSNSGTTATISNILPATYQVVVTDFKNCSTSATAIVTSKPLPVINSFTSAPATICPGTDFTLTVQSSSGTVTNSFTSGALNLAIPDNTPAGVNNTIAISSGIALSTPSQLSVILTFGTGTVAPNRKHTWVGDLKVTLTTPGGSTIVFDRPGVPATTTGTNGDMTGSYTFTTTATDILPQTNSASTIVGGNVVNGNYKPSDGSNPDAAHLWSGLTFPFNINGNWMMNISDNAGSDVGDLVSWGVSFVTTYSHVVSGPGNIGAISCNNSDCSNASVIVSNAPTGSQSYTVITTAPDGCTTSGTSVVNVSCDVFVNVKAFIQGFYLGANKMIAAVDPATRPTLCDTITVELRNNVSPYQLMFSAKDTVDVNGNSHVRIPNVVLNKNYYVVVKHRNSLETWSKNPVLFSASSVSYDFSTAANKAYGDNEASLNDGNFGLWSGDVNQDGTINQTDFNGIENAARLFTTGYSVYDITGNRVTESADYSLVENNFGTIIIRP